MGVSLRSAQGLYGFIDKHQYSPYVVILSKASWKVRFDDGTEQLVDRNDFSFQDQAGQRIRFDYAWITIHGTPGEDGLLQGYFELIGLPYSCCGVLAAAMTFNKFTCNQYLKGFGVKVAQPKILRNLLKHYLVWGTCFDRSQHDVVT